MSVALTRIQEIVSEVMGTQGWEQLLWDRYRVVAHHLAGLVSAPDGGGSGPPSKELAVQAVRERAARKEAEHLNIELSN